MTQVRVADWLMRRLSAEGVRQLFVLPGGGAMHLNDALARADAIEAVPCHHEQACGIAAEAAGRVGGAAFGVAMVTCGPGATNILTPVAGAWIESLPMLVLSGQVKRADLLAGRPLRQGGVQEVDIARIAAPITAYCVTVTDPTRIRYHLERALHVMRTGRRGPAWLDIPLDVQAALVDPDALEGFVPDDAPVPVRDADLDALLAALARAERPLLLAGHGVRISGAAAAFRALAERLGIPVVTTWNALDLLPWAHPLVVGRPGTVALRAPNFAVQACDLLVAVGCRMDNVLTAYAPANFAPHATRFAVDVDADELARHGPGVRGIAAEALAFLEAWGARPMPATPDWSAWRARCADWKARYGIGDGQPMPTSGTISHFRLVDALSEAIPEDRLVVTGSSGLAVEVFYTVFRNRPGQRVFLTSGLGAMGYGLAAAIGACVAAGRRQTVCVESDGSLQLNLQELATWKALDLPMVMVLMDNGGYASIRNTQRNYFEGRYLGTGPEAGLLLPDPLRVAAAYDIPAMRIETVEQLADGLTHALAQRGPFLCVVRLTPDEVLAPKAAAIPRADGTIVSMPLEDMTPLLPLDVLEAELGWVSARSREAREGAA